jgi:hypothetical protein
MPTSRRLREVRQPGIPPTPGIARHAGRDEVGPIEGEVRPLVERDDVIGDKPARRFQAPMAPAGRCPNLRREASPCGRRIEGVVGGSCPVVCSRPGALTGWAPRPGSAEDAATEASHQGHATGSGSMSQADAG